MSFQKCQQRRALSGAGLFLLLPGLLSLTGCGTQAQNSIKVQDDLAECLRCAQTSSTDTEARKWADRAVAIAPQDSVTYLGARDPNPNNPLPQLTLAAVFADVGDDPASADYMGQAVQKFPEDERGYQILAQTQEELGRTAAQKATATQLVALMNKKLKTPGATDIQTLTTTLAQAYFDSGDVADGTATYKKAIQAYPTEPLPVNNLAYAYAVRGTNLPEALTLATQAISLAQKQNASAEEIAGYQDTLGWVQYQQGNYAEAEQNLLQAANALPRLSEIRYHLGLVYAAQGSTEAARAELGSAVQLTQGYAAAQRALDSLPKSTLPDTVPVKPAPSKAAVAAAH